MSDTVEPVEAETFAELAKAARKASGLTGEAVGEAIGRTRETVNRWENGVRTPTDADLVIKWADVVGVSRNRALRAAGIRALAEERVDLAPVDPDADTIRDISQSSAPDWMKEELIQHVRDERAREEEVIAAMKESGEAARRRYVQMALKATGKTGLNKP